MSSGAQWWGEISLPPRHWLKHDPDPILLQSHDAPFVSAFNLRDTSPSEVAAKAWEDTE